MADRNQRPIRPVGDWKLLLAQRGDPERQQRARRRLRDLEDEAARLGGGGLHGDVQPEQRELSLEIDAAHAELEES